MPSLMRQLGKSCREIAGCCGIRSEIRPSNFYRAGAFNFGDGFHTVCLRHDVSRPVSISPAILNATSYCGVDELGAERLARGARVLSAYHRSDEG